MNTFSARIVFFCIAIAVIIGSCSKKDETLFISMSPSSTNIHFTNKLEKHRLFNILYYLYYYNGGGVATGDINNDGLTDIYFTANNKAGNKLYLNKGNFKFEDITVSAGVAGTADWCTGVTMADINGDGLLDIYVSSVSNRYGLKGRNELFINKGNGKFTESAAEYGLDISCFTTQTAFFDYDHDGDLDCFILNQSHNPHANIVDTSFRRKYDSLSGDRLYRNDMNTFARKFVEVSSQAGIYQSNLGYGLGLAVADINNDGWEDIYIGNDFHENDYYYVNNGDGTFTESGAKHFNHYSRFSMGNDIADYNNDGQLDIVTVDMLPPDEKTVKSYGSDENPDTYKIKLDRNGYQTQVSRNCLQRNNGDGTSFSDIALVSGMQATDWSWSALFADFDNNGNKDLFISSGIVKRPVDLDYIRYVSDLKFKGMDRTDKYDDDAIKAMPDGSSHPYFFSGDGANSFKNVSADWGVGNLKGFYNGASYADLDNDGRLDMVINCIDAPALVLKNNAPQKNYLTVSFKGDKQNTFGIGASAYVFSGGKMQYQQLMLTRGFQSSCDTRLHFGLDSMAIDSVVVVWPDQQFQVIKNTPVNKALIADKASAAGTFDRSVRFQSSPALFAAVDEKDTPVNWAHKENTFFDYNVQYLIPHAESTRGPKLAVGDVNGDGLDDFYVCGASGQPGALMVQEKNGTFISRDTAVFKRDAPCEDVDAVFFDANGDGKIDLYVSSGGNEYMGNNSFLLDRLYMNDGKGGFVKSVGSLPPIFQNKSTVAVADIDNDGDSDLFVGVLADPVAYGIPQTSYLLINNGKGNFSIADKSVANLDQLGLVTSAQFADLNGDSYKDLVVAGEWMGITIFTNNNGKFTKATLPNSSGLWQTVLVDDINMDGKMDILAGNWGLNSKLKTDSKNPLKLFIKDFDKNGSVEQIMSYSIDGKDYSFLAKDELERRLPVLKKAYLKYEDVAGKTVQYMLYDLLDGNTEVMAEELASCYFMNDGKAGFTKTVFPVAQQLSPIFCFEELRKIKTGDSYFITGGNFFDVFPYEGRYDAQPFTVFDSNIGTIKELPQQNLSAIKGQVRDIKFLRSARYGELMIVARNNEPLLFFVNK